MFLSAPPVQAKDAAVNLDNSIFAGGVVPANKGETLYTQFSLFYEGKAHLTTNYRRGILVPVNTEVTFVKASSGEIHVKLPDGVVLRLENVRKYSGENIVGIFNRTLGKAKVNLEKFSPKERESILVGHVETGMSKDAVIRAIGYPPKHQTPSLEISQWRYWRSRYATFIVHFKDGNVSSIKK